MKTTKTDEEMGGGRVMRIRVKVNITKPFVSGKEEGVSEWKRGLGRFPI